MAKKDKANMINRNRYNDIKRMDHSTMDACIRGYYEQGYNEGYRSGQREADRFDMSAAMDEISQIKGIGSVKLSQIRLALIGAGAEEPERNREDDKNNTDGSHTETGTWKDKMLSKFIGRRQGNIV